jgi:hypothetical protein
MRLQTGFFEWGFSQQYGCKEMLFVSDVSHLIRRLFFITALAYEIVFTVFVFEYYFSIKIFVLDDFLIAIRFHIPLEIDRF